LSRVALAGSRPGVAVGCRPPPGGVRPRHPGTFVRVSPRGERCVELGIAPPSAVERLSVFEVGGVRRSGATVGRLMRCMNILRTRTGVRDTLSPVSGAGRRWRCALAIHLIKSAGRSKYKVAASSKQVGGTHVK
jgi:hypothetical protein